MSGEISKFCKECLIICIPATPVVDEGDGDCPMLDETDSELKPSQHEACLSATWVQSWKKVELSTVEYQNSRRLIVYYLLHTSRGETKRCKCIAEKLWPLDAKGIYKFCTNWLWSPGDTSLYLSIKPAGKKVKIWLPKQSHHNSLKYGHWKHPFKIKVWIPRWLICISIGRSWNMGCWQQNISFPSPFPNILSKGIAF